MIFGNAGYRQTLHGHLSLVLCLPVSRFVVCDDLIVIAHRERTRGLDAAGRTRTSTMDSELF